MKPGAAAAAARPKQHGASMTPVATQETRIAMNKFRAPLLLLSLTLGAPGCQAAPAEGSALFLRQWRAALGSGEAQALAELTDLPGFLFDGRPQDHAGFVKRVMPALFTPRQRACLQQAKPLTEPDGRWQLWCKPYGYTLGPDAQGRWKLLAFSAEGED